MSHQLIPLPFGESSIRFFPTDNRLSFWVVAKDVTDALGYASAKDGLRLVPENHKGRHSVPTLGGIQDMLCVDEAGLYRLILRSKKPEAEPFMEWVTAEVLPSIRRTGIYNVVNSTRQTNKTLKRHNHYLKQCVRESDTRTARVHHYLLMGLNFTEIGKLLDCSRQTVSKEARTLARCGMLTYPCQNKLGHTQGHHYPQMTLGLGGEA